MTGFFAFLIFGLKFEPQYLSLGLLFVKLQWSEKESEDLDAVSKGKEAFMLATTTGAGLNLAERICLLCILNKTQILHFHYIWRAALCINISSSGFSAITFCSKDFQSAHTKQHMPDC